MSNQPTTNQKMLIHIDITLNEWQQGQSRQGKRMTTNSDLQKCKDTFCRIENEHELFLFNFIRNLACMIMHKMEISIYFNNCVIYLVLCEYVQYLNIEKYEPDSAAQYELLFNPISISRDQIFIWIHIVVTPCMAVRHLPWASAKK